MKVVFENSYRCVTSTVERFCTGAIGTGRIKPLPAIVLALLFAVFITSAPVGANGQSVDLAELSLEDLMDIEVTSVSKKAEKLSDAAAAVYVITGDEIAASGARSIPEALRVVPGLHVASIDGSTWAVSARGFNASFANKLLVLIDGRTVYSTLFSGVWWDIQDLLLSDVERIEVIRGPGATLWGMSRRDPNSLPSS